MTTSPTNDITIDALLYPTLDRWNSTIGTGVTVTYSFMNQVPNYYRSNAVERNGFAVLNETQKDGARRGLQLCSEISGIAFQEVSDAGNGGMIRFGTAALPSISTVAHAYRPGDSGASGDIWLNNTNSYNLDQSNGSVGFQTMLHEIGHAIGLKHPFDEEPYLPDALDYCKYTVMSYHEHPNMSIEPQTPMLFDIKAIQYLYGVNWNTRSGNDTYSWETNQVFIQTIWDGGGIDLISADNQTSKVKINLNQGTYSSINGVENLAIAEKAEIEKALGGLSNDTLVGNSLDNTLAGKAGNDSLQGDNGNDFLQGDSGNDTLNGGTGNNTLEGGAGNDLYMINNTQELINETSTLATEIDTVQSDFTYTLVANLETLILVGTSAIGGTGNALNNNITGNSANNILSGQAGNDRLGGGTGNDTLEGGTGDNTLEGGAGNDFYMMNNTQELINETSTLATEIDTVQSDFTYTLVANLETLILAGTSAINGIGNALNNNITGNSANNILEGKAGNDKLVGGAGNDSLEGGDGNDNLNGESGNNTLGGGTGNDLYIINNTQELITETSTIATEIDTVQSAVSYSLVANLETLNLTGTSAINGTGNAFNNSITGNNANNILSGQAGNDTLNGGSGNNTLGGGAGNDFYIINNTQELITETSTIATEIDTVQSAVSYSLVANLETLNLTGTSAINGTGNAFNNSITGNNANNILSGQAGNDTLNGASGNNTLSGGAGNDLYIINNTQELITETSTIATEIDTVRSAVTYILGSNLENLILTGTSAINGTGNALNNSMTGNSANNLLSGQVGNDNLVGGGGNDTLSGSVGNSEKDTLTGGAGVDLFVLGNSFNNFYNGDYNLGYGIITDLESGDKIQLKKFSFNYVLIKNLNLVGTASLDTAICTSSGDIIGVVQDNTSLITSMSSNFFSYV